MHTTHLLPPALRDRYRITKPMPGGPTFALPHYGVAEVDFRTITVAQCETLLRNNFPHLARVTQQQASNSKAAKAKKKTKTRP